MKRFTQYVTPVTLAAMAAMPLLVGAQTVNSSLDKILVSLTKVIPILMVLATITFLWGVIKYVIASDPDAKADGRNYMIYGIIGLAAMVAVWGVARLLVTTFDVGGEGIPVGPGQY
jgi:hypothetical protein